jgi:hypothetical protein
MSRLAYIKLAKLLNKRGIKFSIFHLRYRESNLASLLTCIRFSC